MVSRRRLSTPQSTREKVVGKDEIAVTLEAFALLVSSRIHTLCSWGGLVRPGRPIRDERLMIINGKSGGGVSDYEGLGRAWRRVGS